MSEIMVTGKLDPKFEHCYRIAVQTEPIPFVIWGQKAESIKRAHANDLEFQPLSR